MSDNFFYRITAAKLLAKVATMTPDQRGTWCLQFAIDLVQGESEDNYTTEVIEEATSYRKQKALAGKRGGEARARKALAESSTVQAPLKQSEANPKPVTEAVAVTEAITEEEQKDKKPARAKKTDLRPPQISDQVWSDFKQHRKTKKAAITQTALNGFIREAEKANITLEQAFIESIDSNWVGFKADWYANKNQGQSKQALKGNDFNSIDYGESGDI